MNNKLTSTRAMLNIMLTVVLTGIFLLGAAACGSMQEDEIVETQIPIVDPVVYVDGVLQPIRDATLAFPAAGEVARILVNEGEDVEEGEALAILAEGVHLEAEIASVEASRVQVEQALDELHDMTELARTGAWQRVLDSRLAVAAAQEEVDDFNMDRYEDDLEDSDTRLADAEADLEEARDDLRDYDDLDPDNPTYQRYEDAVEDALEELHEAEQERAEIEVDYDQLVLNLDRAVAEHERAVGDFGELQGGPDPDEVHVLETQLAAFDARLASLHAQLDDLTLRAPFAGTVARLDLTEGTYVMAGVPVIWMADFTTWVVETEDLTEHEVVRVHTGDPVTGVPDALPDVRLDGMVESIERIATPYLGDVTYTATISIEEVPEELRWGMTIVIEFLD